MSAGTVSITTTSIIYNYVVEKSEHGC